VSCHSFRHGNATLLGDVGESLKTAVQQSSRSRSGAYLLFRQSSRNPAPRCGEALDAEKMRKAVWLKPKLVTQMEFLEWTDADRLRHSKFVGLREDKDPRNAVKALRRHPRRAHWDA